MQHIKARRNKRIPTKKITEKNISNESTKCSETKKVSTRIFVPIEKLNKEKQIVVGIVLQPETVDAQGDIYSSEVIQDAAHKFLSSYNKSTKLGLNHKNFKPKFELYESYISPVDLVIGSSIVKTGSWIISIHVADNLIWKKIKDGELKGLSIGGTAKAVKTSK